MTTDAHEDARRKLEEATHRFQDQSTTAPPLGQSEADSGGETPSPTSQNGKADGKTR